MKRSLRYGAFIVKGAGVEGALIIREERAATVLTGEGGGGEKGSIAAFYKLYHFSFIILLLFKNYFLTIEY